MARHPLGLIYSSPPFGKPAASWWPGSRPRQQRAAIGQGPLVRSHRAGGGCECDLRNPCNCLRPTDGIIEPVKDLVLVRASRISELRLKKKVRRHVQG
jgi:hypothetical protein